VDNILNAGKSGDTTDDVLARLDSALAAKPQKIFLMIGINDFWKGKDVPYVLANYTKIIARIKAQFPSAQIYIQSVLPVNNGISQMGVVDSEKIITLNNKLNSLADGKKILFLNLYPNFCGSDNQMYSQYTNDGVHLNANGYAVWKNMTAVYIK
jgi:lysophospholipase L1-like esterase